MTKETLSDFIRNATPDEKAKVYGEVMDKAAAAQAETIARTSDPNICYCGEYGGGVHTKSARCSRPPSAADQPSDHARNSAPNTEAPT